MTSAAIRDMITMAGNSIGNSLAATAKAAAPGQTTFEEVLSNQTKGNAEDAVFGVGAGGIGQKDDIQDVKSTKVSDKEKPDVTGSKETELTTDSPEGVEEITDFEDAEKLEEAMEVLAGAAMELMQQIADTFGMTVEEVQATMETMGLSATDLFSNDNLNALVLQISGTEGMEALLTDEDLYLKFKALMAGKEQILEEASRQLTDLGVQIPEGTSLEEFAGKLVEVVNAEEQKPAVSVDEAVDAGPDITLDVQEDDYDVSVDKSNMQVRDEQALQTEQTVQSVSENRGSNAEAGQHFGRQQENKDANATVAPQTVQNTQFEQTSPQVTQTAEASTVWDADTQNIMRQIMDYMRISVKPDVSNLEMQLHPASLGNLKIQLATKEGAVSAQFIAQNEAVKAALESQMIQLKESFAEQGVKVAEIEVTVQTNEFQQNLEQGRGREQQEASGRSRIRRINLDGFLSADENDMTEEDRLVADMMAANGSSVDYTA